MLWAECEILGDRAALAAAAEGADVKAQFSMMVASTSSEVHEKWFERVFDGPSFREADLWLGIANIHSAEMATEVACSEGRMKNESDCTHTRTSRGWRGNGSAHYGCTPVFFRV